MATQYPVTQLTCGGQPTVSGFDVLSSKEGFQEDRESYQNADGTHKADVVYSRRRTWDLTMQAQNGASVDQYAVGGTITINSVLCNITAADVEKTRGPSVVTLTAIELVDGIEAVTTTTVTTTV